jgi:hypothetical protein
MADGLHSATFDAPASAAAPYVNTLYDVQNFIRDRLAAATSRTTAALAAWRSLIEIRRVRTEPMRSVVDFCFDTGSVKVVTDFVGEPQLPVSTTLAAGGTVRSPDTV